jgi:hypothetical protein
MVISFLTVAGLFAAGPEQRVVTYTYTNEMTEEGYCDMTAEADAAQVTEEEKFIQSGDPADAPPDPEDDCDYYAKYGAVWVPPEYERQPVTRVERTNAWERIKGAVTGS